MIFPIIVLGPLYHVENGNPNQNPAGFNKANSHFFGTVLYGVYFCGYELSNDEGQKSNFSSQKRSKFQILSYRCVIYLKRKLRTCTIKIQPEKVRFLRKKLDFFAIF